MNPRIRRYRDADHGAVYDVCVRTADAGGDARGQYRTDDLMGDLFVGPYLFLEPEFAFVLDDGQRAVGYVLGTPDTAAFARAYRDRWIPRLTGRYPVPPDPPASPDDEMLALHYRPERFIWPGLPAYPAHLHIDLLPAFQGAGHGRALIETFCAAARRAGAPGVHVVVVRENKDALAFYPRVGFGLLEVAAPSPVVYLGRGIRSATRGLSHRTTGRTTGGVQGNQLARIRQDGVMQPRDFSLYGAVDLGARQQAAQRRQQAAASAGQAGPGGSAEPGGAIVIDVTEETFNTDVVEVSRTTPVIMDLWAEWCGPCKQLSPVLEKLAAEAAGQWILAKVDVDANPQLSAALQVQSIPMVVAVIGGQLVDGFLGAMPEAQVRQWIGQVLGVAEKMGLPVTGGIAPADGATDADEATDPDQAAAPAQGGQGAMPGMGAPDIPPAYAEARAAMERGDLDGAAKAFEQQLASAPADPVAKAGLAQVNLVRRVSSYDQAQARRDAAEHPGDAEAQIRVADIELATGRVEEAFDRLLGVVRRTSGEERDRARKHLVELFEILPPRDPLVSRARATLSSLLF